MKTTKSVLLLVLTVTTSLAAQTKPQPKGVWEPVSFSEDIEFRDVFFVNGDVGWVAGNAGTILHTTDGGKNWHAQLGGDPQNVSEPISMLRFFDERHGWAVHERKLLQTRDGEQWEEIGTLPYGTIDLVFISPQDGLLTGKAVETSMHPQVIYRTRDGGRTRKPAWTCAAKATINGLVRNIGCNIQSLHFPTPQVGYAVLGTTCVGMGCGPPPLIAKTEDGGESWQAMVGPGVIDQDYVTTVFFTDEQTGFARLASGKLHATRDGGKTWRGLVASPGQWLRFTDPGVGWSFEPANKTVTLTYTTDGGARWSARDMRFPAAVNAMSMPRRDRAYAVGPHGMIYRYRVVPPAHALRSNDVAAPAMPGFDSPLDEQAEQLAAVVEELTTTVGPGPESSKAADDATVETKVDASEPLGAPLPEASAFAANCCGKSFSKLEVILGAIAQSLPQLSEKYRNLNLLFGGIRMGSDLPAQYRTVKGALRAFRQAEHQEAAQAALAEVSATLNAFKQTTAVALQKQLPPVEQ